MGEAAQVGSWPAVRGRRRTVSRVLVALAVLMALGAAVMLVAGRPLPVALLWWSQAALLGFWGVTTLLSGTGVRQDGLRVRSPLTVREQRADLRFGSTA